MHRPDIVTPRALFQTNARYLAPVFQRYYTWTDVQLDDFFDDLDELANAHQDTKQFLGAIVLQQKHQANPGAPVQFLIIDGQQRLTTVYLVLLGLAELMHEFKHSEEANTIVEGHLAISTPKYRGEPRVVPTAQDRERFYEILRRATGYRHWNFSSEPPAGVSGEKLDRQWRRVREALRDRLVTSGGRLRRAEWTKLGNMILDRLEMVGITLDADEDPNIIFSRLNARGTPLGVADLVRNSVFSRFDHPNPRDSERFYTEHWLPFERMFSDRDALEHYFQPFAIIRTEGRATQATAFADLEERWEGLTPGQVLDDLREYAAYFASLTKFEPIERLHPRMNRALRDFADMPKVSVSWPFILQTIRANHTGRLDWRSAERSLRVVESMLVRRALFGWEPTGLHAIFKDLWPQTLGDPKKVAVRVQTSTIKTPTDAELLKELRTAPVDRRRILPFVLKQLERERRDEEGTEESFPSGTITIEHVAPLSYESHWQTAFPTSESHDESVGLLGNLTLLAGKHNQRIANQNWGQKRQRFTHSDWLVSRDVASKRRWNGRAIEERTNELAAWAVRRWPSLSR
jgi:uncharacterized protein DUF262/uncharacterized protein DUF1524